MVDLHTKYFYKNKNILNKPPNSRIKFLVYQRKGFRLQCQNESVRISNMFINSGLTRSLQQD